jgi:signal transduction histidine kinase
LSARSVVKSYALFRVTLIESSSVSPKRLKSLLRTLPLAGRAERRNGQNHHQIWAQNKNTWYGVGIGLIGFTAWLRWRTDPLLGDLARFLPFIPTIAICTYGGGIGPGVASLAAAATLATLLFVDHPLSPRGIDLANLSLFVSEAGSIVLLTARLRQKCDRLQEAVSRTEAAVRQREQFVARVSHEWRGPLNVLTGWTAQLLNRPQDREFVARAATGMMRAIETQQRLADDLLDYSRGSRGQLAIHPVRLLIATPIDASVEAVRQEAAAKGIELTMAPADPSMRVWGDNLRLQQVFTNLLTNSIKFTPARGRITVHRRRVRDVVEIAIEDTGAGIDPHLLQEVFEPFAQTDPSRDAALGGLGLGLSIAREIVLLHAGTIEASSAGPGYGSTFTVRLPVSASVSQNEAASKMFEPVTG